MFLELLHDLGPDEDLPSLLELPTLPLEEDDVKLCNCAGCRVELLGESMLSLLEDFGIKKSLPRRYWQHQGVYARIKGRPYCQTCTILIEQQEDFRETVRSAG